jgi:hypothetical protein
LRNLRNPPEINQSNGRFLAKLVMPGPVHPRPDSLAARKTWMAGTRPAMTENERSVAITAARMRECDVTEFTLQHRGAPGLTF